jgi:hypothetical protein
VTLSFSHLNGGPVELSRFGPRASDAATCLVCDSTDPSQKATGTVGMRIACLRVGV